MSPRMFKIDFYVIGTQKGGTTTLHDILVQHDDIRLPRIKETHYFSHEDRRTRGADWYRAQFPDRPGARLTGEVDPEYMFSSVAAERVAAETGAQKVIFVLRNPIRRAYSQYLMTKRRGYEDLDFRTALLAEQERMAGEHIDFAYDHWSYAARGFYADQIERWQAALPEADFLFLMSETLTRADSNSETGYDRVCRFIGTEPHPELLEDRARSNVASAPQFSGLRDMIYAAKGRSALRRRIMALLPAGLKRRIFLAIDRLNQRPITHQDETAFDDLPQPLLRAMLDDTARTATLTGLDLTAWEKDVRALMAQGAPESPATVAQSERQPRDAT